MRRWLIVIAATTAALIGGVVGRQYWQTEPVPKIGGYVLPSPRALPPVALVDEQGRAFGPADFAGHWSFLYFGYTYCPDVCPLTLVELANLKKALAEQLPDTPTDYYLVSVDPARDTPERLREYVTYFDAGFHGLTGSLDDLKSLTQQTGSVFFIPEGQPDDAYLVSHSSNIALVDPAGHLAAVFTSPHAPKQLAADFAHIVAYRTRR
ncbi:MAG: SCO family protein [Gammaproteobacteria bacterium]